MNIKNILHWLWIIPLITFLTPIGWVITYFLTNSWLCVFGNMVAAVLFVILHEHFTIEPEYRDDIW
jgi:hypothetical protein